MAREAFSSTPTCYTIQLAISKMCRCYPSWGKVMFPGTFTSLQVICPFILDQFYWAERMFWLGVAPEPLKSSCLLPDNDDDSCIFEAANMLVGAINYALSPEVKLHAKQIANRLSTEVSSIIVWIDDATSQTRCMYIGSGSSQRKRSGPITHRSQDRKS
ncbi:UNVERIFIED_CONTAM: hypothetical protein Sradi_4731100 [Sesamum radiatum]|uniref:Uncharacterized protein n=1 Tax=Sesamum radiatum TaxID=300843 RepID=A0AAW2MU63_SESRA